MEILEIKEPKDGICEISLLITEEENRMLIEYAVNNILKTELSKNGG